MEKKEIFKWKDYTYDSPIFIESNIEYKNFYDLKQELLFNNAKFNQDSNHFIKTNSFIKCIVLCH